MSAITKEWLQQKIADMEATRDEIPFGLDEDDSNTLAAMKLALASLEAEAVEWRVAFRLDGQPGSDFEKTFENQAKMNEIISLHERAGFSASIAPLYTAPPAPANAEPIAWLWSHRKHPSEVTLVRPEDDERAEGAHWSGWSCQALYAAPPAPVSVPTFEEWCERSEQKPVGWVRDAMKEAYDGCRAAMLQGAENAESRCTIQTAPALDSSPKIAESRCSNSSVVPDCSCRTCRPVTFADSRFVVCPECGNKRCPRANDHRNACTGSNEPGQIGSAYPAAPRQEVKP